VAKATKVEIRVVPVIVNGVEVKKEYIVHKLLPMKDTLFALSFQYNVSKRDIQNINKLPGDDIFSFKELLIPYKG